jgi:hypothetical protein
MIEGISKQPIQSKGNWNLRWTCSTYVVVLFDKIFIVLIKRTLWYNLNITHIAITLIVQSSSYSLMH